MIVFFHITWVTHNSRKSERMLKYKIKKGASVILNDEQEIEITSYISKIIKEDNLLVFAYNICRDHIHIVIACEEEKLTNIIRKLKGKSTQLYKENHDIKDKLNLWAQKFNTSFIYDNYPKLISSIEYVNNNRKKHNLYENKELQIIISEMCTVYEQWVATHCSEND